MASTPASAPTSKKSFFKKPTWATTAPPGESGDFFRHSDTVYDSILREKERRREKHAQKKQAKVNVEAEEEGRENKRRRISIEDEELEEGAHSDSETGSTGSGKEEVPERKLMINGYKSPTVDKAARESRPSPSNTTSTSNRIIPTDSKVIELESDEEKSQLQTLIPEKKTQKPTSDDEVSEEEDEYVLELKRKAREKARLGKLGIDNAAGQTRASHTPETQERPGPFSEDSSFGAKPKASPNLPPKKDETIVQILINTKIPNTKPLIVNRKVSQPLQHVREVWCARQNFDASTTAKVIFTWRGKRLYDTSTSTHLLNVLKKERAREMGGLADDDDDEDPSRGKIVVEAVTKETYEQEQLRKSQEGTGGDPNADTDYSVQDQQSLERSTTPKEAQYTVVMNAQGLEALHLRVRPNTAISKMMAAFKKMRNLDPGKTCWLVFDGDRLEPDSTVADTEIEDGDAVEVHVR
jgi:Ubiquitin-2 like Rad60 SUMO-like